MRTVRLWTSASACLLAASAIGAEPQLTNKLTLGMSLDQYAAVGIGDGLYSRIGLRQIRQLCRA